MRKAIIAALAIGFAMSISLWNNHQVSNYQPAVNHEAKSH